VAVTPIDISGYWVINSTRGLLIGAGQDESTGIKGSYFNGSIDDVKIWNYALTEEQVKNEYNGGAVRFGN